MTKVQKLYRMFLIIALVVAVDQATKYYAMHMLMGREPISLFGDTVRFLFAENRGGFLSLGANLSEASRQLIFLFLTAGFLFGFFIYVLLEKSGSKLFFISSSAIIGGGIGNLIDRALRDGAVIDFVNMGIGWLRTGVFNVADMVVLFGCISLFFTLKSSETN